MTLRPFNINDAPTILSFGVRISMPSGFGVQTGIKNSLLSLMR